MYADPFVPVPLCSLTEKKNQIPGYHAPTRGYASTMLLLPHVAVRIASLRIPPRIGSGDLTYKETIKPAARAIGNVPL